MKPVQQRLILVSREPAAVEGPLLQRAALGSGSLSGVGASLKQLSVHPLNEALDLMSSTGSEAGEGFCVLISTVHLRCPLT